MKKPPTKIDSSVAPEGSRFRTLTLALAGSLLLWAAFPPLDLWPLAWIAPVPWLLLVRIPKLTGWKPYLQIWLAGFVHWLLMLQGVRLAHPALYGGWLALAAYLAAYLVLFVAIARVAVQQLRWPLWLAAPLVWIGIELLRSHLISGFASGLLAHTQTAWPMILQMADLGGGYFVSGLMILVASSLTQMIPGRWLAFPDDANEPLPHWLYGAWLPSILASAALAGAIGYGAWRLHEALPPNERQPLNVALIQGSLDTRFDQDPDERIHETFTQYAQLTVQAVQKKQPLDLIIWPESMFAMAEYQAKNDKVPDAFRERFTEGQKPFRNMVERALGAMPNSAFLFGTTTFVYDLEGDQSAQNYNTALLIAPGGNTAGRYYKMHAVMFGEYIPCADLFPFLYRVTPMPAGLSTGLEPVAMDLKGHALAPNICFESTVPHLIREQVATLERARRKPVDVIVNVSNDGWFKGSAILDLHFRGSILRAIENRKPVIIAANTGISAHVDGCGRVLTRGPKRAPQVLIASVTADGRASPYHFFGDVPAWLCAWLTWGLAMYGVWRR